MFFAILFQEKHKKTLVFFANPPPPLRTFSTTHVCMEFFLECKRALNVFVPILKEKKPIIYSISEIVKKNENKK